MTDTLYPYQQEGAIWLAERRGISLLADEMGLGKSAQVVVACNRTAEFVTVLCPAIARHTWLREWRKFSLYTARVDLLFSAADLPEDFGGSVVVCSYDLLANSLVRKFLRQRAAETLVLDEVHFLKNPDAARTKHVFGKEGLVHVAQRVYALSGTPAPNHAGELWLMLYLSGQTSLSYPAFIDRFCNSVPPMAYAAGPRGRERIVGTKQSRIPELRDMLGPIMLRRRVSDVLPQLPPIAYSTKYVEAGPVDIELCWPDRYLPGGGGPESVKADVAAGELLTQAGVAEASGIHTGKRAAREAVLDALKSTTTTYRRYTGLQKVDAVAAMVEGEFEVGAYDKVVIFAHHRDVIDGLRRRLHAFNPVTLYGGQTPEKKDRNVVRFQTDPYCRVFIGNILAAGTNVTLTASNNVIVVEPDWVPGNNAQAIMRVRRIGQLKPVFVRFVALADSIDEAVTEVCRRKTKELTELLDEGGNKCKPLS